jgi:uncharacterized double-CXXCG motif protein
MRFFLLEYVYDPRYAWECQADSKWGLPGVCCPTCNITRGGPGESYPAVDLSGLPEHKLFEEAWFEEDFARFQHLRERVRPLVPPGALLEPGATFGPLIGSARGDFPPVVMQEPWTLLMRREALEQLQSEGLRGLYGCRTELRFQQRDAPELLELQVELGGMLHPDCIPPGKKTTPCATCGMYGFSKPKDPILDGTSLPTDRDLFRVTNASTAIVGSERFVEAVLRLGFEEVNFQEWPVRQPPASART